MPKFAKKYRVYYEDTDAGGVVYYANYLKFFERARTDFLRDLEISQQNLAKAHNIIFVVRKCEINYAKPAKLDDLIEVNLDVVKIGSASIKMHQEISLDQRILSQLQVEIVCVNSTNFKPQKIPQQIIEKIKSTNFSTK